MDGTEIFLVIDKIIEIMDYFIINYFEKEEKNKEIELCELK